MHVIVTIVGLTGAGKSAIADVLVAKEFQFLRFGQITLDEVKRRNLAPTEENERPIREELRKKYGMGAFATLNIPKFDELLKEGNVVGDGLYSWTEYKILKEHYGKQLVVLAVHASPEVRYARLEKRALQADDAALRHRPATREQSQSRDYAEIENIEKGGPIAMADYHIVNHSSIENLNEKIGTFLNWLEKEKNAQTRI